jgi:hypothetical protein
MQPRLGYCFPYRAAELHDKRLLTLFQYIKGGIEAQAIANTTM